MPVVRTAVPALAAGTVKLSAATAAPAMLTILVMSFIASSLCWYLTGKGAGRDLLQLAHGMARSSACAARRGGQNSEPAGPIAAQWRITTGIRIGCPSCPA